MTRRTRRSGLSAGLLSVTIAALGSSPIPVEAGPITVGAGPLLGTDRAGVAWLEQFQDWTHADLRALDDLGSADATFAHGDGQDDSRDLVAFYFREEASNLYFRVDLYDLALGAESSALDIYVAIDVAPGGQVWMPDFLDVQTDRPWELCLAVDEVGTAPGSDYRMWDASFASLATGYLGSHFHSELDAVEFGITRQTLLDQGWDGVTPPVFQVFTTKDGAETSCSGGGRSSDVTDAFVDDDRGCGDGMLNGGTPANAAAGKVFYATIAHGNQSVNRAGEIGEHVYDPEASTGIPGGTGFQRTLDTHEIFRVPLNIHPSGTLLIALAWARVPGGPADPRDGPGFVARIAEFVDADQSETPGSLIGGVLAEHILPYFEGPVNAASIARTDSLLQEVFGLGAADLRVMHVPERVIRSESTGLTPLNGHTFESIAASPYTATVLDEVTHLHWWFHAGESCQPDAGYRHKVHRINDVYCFMINEREDGAKFGNHDGGMVLDTRFSLAQKALYGSSSEIVVVFDDWEALAGKSFNPTEGVSVPNDNPNRYHATIRWAANHPWIEIANLNDLLALALADPASFVIDHGFRFDLGVQTYEWLKHASEDSYNYWYYNENAGFSGNEQSFYDLVPVITGPQGDYFTRGETPAQDGPPLPSGMIHGDLNSPGTLMHESWDALVTAPAGGLRELGIWSFVTMIYETAWHEEEQVDYSDSDCYQGWLFPDTSWDGVNTWALRLQNHVRQAGLWARAAAWAEDVRTGAQGAATITHASDLDFDGEDEYVIANERIFAIFERYGGRCVLAAAFDPSIDDAIAIVGAPFTNPSAPGEEELVGTSANRCSAFKEMNDGIYADAPYTASALPGGWRFESPDGLVVKSVTAADGSAVLHAAYDETVAGPLYVRLGLSPHPLDLAFHGHAHLAGALDVGAGTYTLENSGGGTARIFLDDASWVAFPPDAGGDRRNLALTEQVELEGEGSFSFRLALTAGGVDPTAAVSHPETAAGLRGPFPSPSLGHSRLLLSLARPGPVDWDVLDVRGRVVARGALGLRGAGEVEVRLEAIDAAGAPLPNGVYFVRIRSGGESHLRKWVVVR